MNICGGLSGLNFRASSSAFLYVGLCIRSWLLTFANEADNVAGVISESRLMIGLQRMSAFLTPTAPSVMILFSAANCAYASTSFWVMLGDVLTGVSPLLLGSKSRIELELTVQS
jgi:hypothetical protein